jgi:periplasmic protein CpxP/Spy
MKKQLLLIASAFILCIGSVCAQNGPRKTPEERTKAAMEKITALNLDADAKTKTEVIISDFYNAQQKAMEAMRASGTPDREAMMTKRKELATERDNKLKTVFTADQLKKWQDEIEPSLRPQRGGGGQNN